jgi:hypothetical protein
MTALAYPLSLTFEAGSFASPDEVSSELQLINFLRLGGLAESARRRLATLVSRAPLVDAVDCAKNFAKERHFVDVWLAENHGDAVRTLIPCATLTPDGVPRFVVAVPRDASPAVLHAISCELVHGGADTELRKFLDEILVEELAYIDFDPGIGFAALTAASAPVPAMATCAVSASASEMLALDAAIQSSELSSCVRVLRNAKGTITTDYIVNDLFDDVREVVVYAGSALAVPAVVHGALNAIRDGRVAAVAWRCEQRAGDLQVSAETFDVEIDSAGTVLSVLGFQHYALAMIDDDVELVPLVMANGNSLVISLSREYLSRAGAA